MIEILQAWNAIIYNTFLIPVIFFSILFYFFAITTILTGKVRMVYRKPKDAEWPSITVQIPVYNDPIAVRCIKKCLKFDYPKDRYHIIVADDSTDSKTRNALDRFVRGKKSVRLVRRKNREGWKAGALNNILPISRGEYIVMFDADFIAPRNFLKKIVSPFFTDDRIAIVQSRMGYANSDYNSITKFASLSLMIFHHVIMPLNSKMKTVMFCGTHGAIKKSVLVEMGGWNTISVTEDADLSLKMLLAGYRTIYLPNLRARGEVPWTLDSFLKQQTRWTYGQTRAMADNVRNILSSSNLIFRQRFMLLFSLLAYIVIPFIIVTAITGQLGWVINNPKPFELSDFLNFMFTFLLTFGYGTMGAVALAREGKIKKSPKIILLVFPLGIIMSVTNLIAFLKAILNRPLTWVKTPKFSGNLLD